MDSIIKNLIKAELVLIVVILLLIFARSSFAQERMLLPADVNWSCMFPISIGGVAHMGSSLNPAADALDASRSSGPVLCRCPEPPVLGVAARWGIIFGMSKPSHTFESTTVPFRFPSLGGIGGSYSPARLGGFDTHSKGKSTEAFTHTHIMSLNFLKLMDIAQDVICDKNSMSDFDVVYLSEIDPTANNSETANLVFPESVLLANPVVAVSCAADALAALAGSTIDAMWWCAGGHALYPMGNFTPQTTSGDDAGAINFVKMMYRHNRETAGQFFGITANILGYPAGANLLCAAFPSPTVIKSQYRIQPAIPLIGFGCERLGAPSIKWNTPKRATTLGNQVMLLWTREDCCAL